MYEHHLVLETSMFDICLSLGVLFFGMGLFLFRERTNAAMTRIVIPGLIIMVGLLSSIASIINYMDQNSPAQAGDMKIIQAYKDHGLPVKDIDLDLNQDGVLTRGEVHLTLKANMCPDDNALISAERVGGRIIQAKKITGEDFICISEHLSGLQLGNTGTVSGAPEN